MNVIRKKKKKRGAGGKRYQIKKKIELEYIKEKRKK